MKEPVEESRIIIMQRPNSCGSGRNEKKNIYLLYSNTAWSFLGRYASFLFMARGKFEYNSLLRQHFLFECHGTWNRRFCSIQNQLIIYGLSTLISQFSCLSPLNSLVFAVRLKRESLVTISTKLVCLSFIAFVIALFTLQAHSVH